MNLIEYQQEAQRTLPDLEDNIEHMYLGIFTEFGELFDIIKKNFAYGKEIDKVHLGEEIADICWYTVNLLTLRGEKADNEILNVDFERDNSEFLKNPRVENFVGYLAVMFSPDRPGDFNNILQWCKEMADMFEIDFEKILDNNIAKLRVRFPEKFDKEKAINRDVKEERKELEK